MTLEEAIEHCRNVANATCGGCSEEHKQLSEWLEELQRKRIGDEEKKERITWCRDCRKLNTMKCHVKRAIVFDLLKSKQLKKNENPPCVCPAGFCAWGDPKEES